MILEYELLKTGIMCILLTIATNNSNNDSVLKSTKICVQLTKPFAKVQ